MTAAQELARAILAAAKAREGSFDHGAAAKSDGLVDVNSFYQLTIRDAAELPGTNPFISYPVYLLLSNSWNDAIDWATHNQ